MTTGTPKWPPSAAATCWANGVCRCGSPDAGRRVLDESGQAEADSLDRRETDCLPAHQFPDRRDRLRGALGGSAVQGQRGAEPADHLMGAVGDDHMDPVALEVDTDQLGAARVE
ncbi:hypothetical protein ABZY02_24565 [Streptomyces sp. NPDC006649]|uniref:hypothetical protein n=1 Tax=Streptomyces sp. NPDC006649 TaxID=3156896 RepID=UPI0033B1842F